jgi:hypothetical protein
VFLFDSPSKALTNYSPRQTLGLIFTQIIFGAVIVYTPLQTTFFKSETAAKQLWKYHRCVFSTSSCAFTRATKPLYSPDSYVMATACRATSP